MSDADLWEQFFDAVSGDVSRWIEEHHGLTVQNVFGDNPSGYENEADIVVTYAKA